MSDSIANLELDFKKLSESLRSDVTRQEINISHIDDNMKKVNLDVDCIFTQGFINEETYKKDLIEINEVIKMYMDKNMQTPRLSASSVESEKIDEMEEDMKQLKEQIKILEGRVPKIAKGRTPVEAVPHLNIRPSKK
mgnify:CR=1 FL=1